MWNRTSGNEIIIHRQRKYEAEQAINDLEKRGYELVYPLTEQKKEGRNFTTDGYRSIFLENTYSSKWIAKLRRVAE